MDDTVREDVPDPPATRVIAVGLTELARPDGETEVVSVMLPAKPPRLFSVIVVLLDWPASIVTLAVFDEMAKSTILIVT